MKTHLAQLLSKLQEMQEHHASVVLQGHLTYDEYRTQCGVLHGLALALREAEALHEKEISDDD